MEILMTFIQFFNSKTEKVETHFLSVEDVLKDSTSANAETIFNILTKKLEDCGLQIQKLSSVASDGAAVMTRERSGVAARLKEVNSKVIRHISHCCVIPATRSHSVTHCTRHRLVRVIVSLCMHA